MVLFIAFRWTRKNRLLFFLNGVFRAFLSTRKNPSFFVSLFSHFFGIERNRTKSKTQRIKNLRRLTKEGIEKILRQSGRRTILFVVPPRFAVSSRKTASAGTEGGANSNRRYPLPFVTGGIPANPTGNGKSIFAFCSGGGCLRVFAGRSVCLAPPGSSLAEAFGADAPTRYSFAVIAFI